MCPSVDIVSVYHVLCCDMTGVSIVIFLLRKYFTKDYEYDHSILDAGPGSHQYCGSDIPSTPKEHVDVLAQPLQSNYGTVHNEEMQGNYAAIGAEEKQEEEGAALKMQHFDLDIGHNTPVKY